MKTKIGVVSLGCDKNRVDTEVMLQKLYDGGFEITSDPSVADVIIVNTCAFLEESRKESIDTILEMADYKQVGNCKKIIVTGCLGQSFGKDVFDGMEEIDAVVGTYDYDNICQIVLDALGGVRENYVNKNECITFGQRVLTTPSHVAYLKIADGCNNFCTYCLIPYIRGRYRSVPMEQIVDHAKDLAQKGVKELVVVAQDTTKYGIDLYGKLALVNLLKYLTAIEGIERITLLYCYPELMTDELIAEIANNPKISKYLDIPLQHVDDSILKAMNRKSNHESICKLFDKLADAQISVRSTFICGFPGETQEMVDEIADFLKKYKLRNVGFFAYSQEEGTMAAKMPNQLQKRTKNKYKNQLYKLQQSIARELNRADVGKVLRCIVDCFDSVDGEEYVYRARAEFMAPDIDGVVFVRSKVELPVGAFCDAKITGSSDYDLIGEVVQV